MSGFFNSSPFMGLSPFGGGGIDCDQLRAIDDKQAYADQRTQRMDDMIVFPDGSEHGELDVLRV